MKLVLPEKVSTERLTLRRLRYEDADEIFYTYASKTEATRFVSWPTHKSVKDTRDFLRYAYDAWINGTDYGYAIRLQHNNRLIGSFGVMNDSGKVQFGYILSPVQWGKGYATEACIAIMKTLELQESIYRIGTFVDIDNVASIRVLQKSGLIEEACLKKWYRFVNQENTPKDCRLFHYPLNR
jgi:[ribosomal protein S5]-alanine N-acetyltransferase